MQPRHALRNSHELLDFLKTQPEGVHIAQVQTLPLFMCSADTQASPG